MAQRDAQFGNQGDDQGGTQAGEQFDVAIIGGGPGGTKAARILAAHGKSVALIEDAHWGGTCLNCGCIPTKMLLGAVAPKAAVAAMERQRVLKGHVDVDYAAVQTRVKRFVNGSSQTLAKALAGMGIKLFLGRGVCSAPHTLTVHGPEAKSELRAGHIILACGSRSAAFPGLTPDHTHILDSTDMLNLPEVPESLIIVGGGAIGLELGDFFAALGSKITLVEAAPHILPTEDADIAADLRKSLTKSGCIVLENVKARSLESRDGMAMLTLEDGTELSAAKALVAVGRTPNTAGLDCEALGCTLNQRGFVTVSEHLEAAPNVYAVGDINGLTLLAHAAEHQAEYVAHRILKQTQPCQPDQAAVASGSGNSSTNGPYASGPVPSCVYGSMEVMRVGRTAKEAAAAGLSVSVSVAPLSANAIAQSHGHTAGFVKAVWHNDTLLGMAAVGHSVSHLITAAQLLVLHGPATKSFMFAHPTLDEALHAALHAQKTPVSTA